jgi:hypothetical protein
LKNLSKSEINEIKLLKSGLYILTNDELRNKYDIVMGFKQRNDPKSIQIFVPEPENFNHEDTLDSLFNVDNSWMKNHEINMDNGSRRLKNNNHNVINNRVFSLSDLNKRPGFSSQFESELRKPQQGREDKSELKMLNSNNENISK